MTARCPAIHASIERITSEKPTWLEINRSGTSVNVSTLCYVNVMMREQSGSTGKGPVDVLVIDHTEPTEN
jgi:hypothetical protein